jgi:phosphatidylinositol 4-kinase
MLKDSSLEHLLIGHLNQCLKNKSNLDFTKFNHYMQLATAYLVAEPTLQIKLLQWLVWTPVFLFSKDSINTAVFCWRWLSSSRPQFELPLLTEIAHAWQWTISQRLGLFSNNKEHEEAVELAVDNSISKANNLENTKPHRIWVNYLAERFQVVSSTAGKDLVHVYINILIRSFEDTSIMSTDHYSLGTRFRLCLLSVIVAKHAESVDAFPVSLLRDRTYAAILDWFTLHPTWYNPASKLTIEEDCRVLKELNRKLALEFSSATIASNRTPGLDLVLSDSRSVYSESKRSLLVGGAASLSRAPSAGSTVKTSGSSSNGGSYSSKASHLISLILLLISHEIERTIIWHDPQNADEVIAQLNTDNTIMSHQFMDPRAWKMYIDTAWNFSPKLALRLPIRFPMDCIRFELQRYVKEHAAELVDIPEAVPYLVTPINVEANIDELKYLLNWSPATLSIALTLLNVPYVKSPLVAQYAIRTLRKFTPEAVVFYLPQLVQCLRHDSSGILKRYLLNVSKSSVMFAHQLIWTLRTEIIPDDYEEMEHIKSADFEISALSKELNDEVFSILDERQLALYKEEFGFFDQLNKISGDLIPVEKDLRTSKLQQAMQVISTTPNLYPPTDTRYRITGFDLRGCITLKSAKKVPILVPFYVKERPPGLDIGQEETEEEQCKQNETKTLMLIFKMGDDCRQDQLALQIISMFKQIFNRLDLPLYLYPYRVITTGRDMGIIECVPNSKSRHDLGGFTEGDLYDYFIKKYGHENTIEFQRARKNFIESMAAYSVVSYILNIKDRHNGNLLVDEEGHLIHIDFGFIFDIAPGGNYGIEVRVPFKLTYEMLLLMGENISKEKQQQLKQQMLFPRKNVSLSEDTTNANIGSNGLEIQQEHAEPFNLFVDLVIRGYLACRDHIDSIISIVEVMLQSELPCFKPDAIKNLRYRLCADKSEREAVKFIREKITASYQNIWSVVYDQYQKRFEGVNA